MHTLRTDFRRERERDREEKVMQRSKESLCVSCFEALVVDIPNVY